MALINQLANQMPVANTQLQRQRKAASDLQLQQAAGARPAGAPITQQAQQVGAAIQQNQGQQMIQQAQQNLQTGQQIGGLALGQQQLQNQQTIQNMRVGLEQARQKQQLDLANLSEGERRELFDSRLQFQQDEMGRKYLNERQMADYALASAVSQDQFRDYALAAEQAHDRNMFVLETASAKIEQALKQQYSLDKQKQDQALTRELEAAKKAMEDKIAKAKRKAAKSGAIWSGALGIAGTAAGAYFGGPTGAAVGNQLGTSLGSAIAGNQGTLEEDLR